MCSYQLSYEGWVSETSKDLGLFIAFKIRERYKPSKGRVKAAGSWSTEKIAADLGLTKPVVIQLLRDGTGARGTLVQKQAAKKFYEGSVDALLAAFEAWNNVRSKQAAKAEEGELLFLRAQKARGLYRQALAFLAAAPTHFADVKSAAEHAAALEQAFDADRAARKGKAAEEPEPTP